MILNYSIAVLYDVCFGGRSIQTTNHSLSFSFVGWTWTVECWLFKYSVFTIVNDIWTYPEGFFQANALHCMGKSSDEDFFPQISPHPLFCRVSGLFLAQLMGTNVPTCSALKAGPRLRRGPDPSATLPFTVRETDGADSRCVFEEAVLDLVQFVVPLTGWFSAQPLIEQ